jgi:hypothetical protein
MLIETLVLLVCCAQNPTGPGDASAISAARQVVVQGIDSALPHVSFDEWLRSIVGSDAPTKWEVNDCGEQAGDPTRDRGRDFPICAEVQVDLGGQRELHVSLSVGTNKTGVAGVPAFRSAYVRVATGPAEWIKGLAEIPSAIRIIGVFAVRLPNNHMEPTRPSSRARISPWHAARLAR